jgi:hypothetical protein
MEDIMRYQNITEQEMKEALRTMKKYWKVCLTLFRFEPL